MKDRATILAMARHEFSEHSVSALRSEYERRRVLKEFDIFGCIQTPGELLALFEMLIMERTHEKVVDLSPDPTGGLHTDTL